MELRKKITNILKEKKKLRLDKFIDFLLYKNNSYYTSKNPIGKKGDFVTSPEISQMFGEIIGVYIINYWKNYLNSKFNLIELGPGRCTLFNDIFRTSKIERSFINLADIFFVEKNDKLIKIQKENINKLKLKNVKWLSEFKTNSSNPSIIYSNEFFDCLPIRQFYQKDNWYEKFVIYNNQKDIFSFKDIVVKNKKLLNNLEKYNKTGIAEISKERSVLFENLCKHIVKNKGLIILVDYGYNTPIKNFTLQTILNHKKTHIFDNIGNQDISSYVDFSELINIAKGFDLNIVNYCDQNNFLLSNGLNQRKEILIKELTKEKQKIIINEYERLISKQNMGKNFKFLIVSSI